MIDRLEPRLLFAADLQLLTQPESSVDRLVFTRGQSASVEVGFKDGGSPGGADLSFSIGFKLIPHRFLDQSAPPLGYDDPAAVSIGALAHAGTLTSGNASGTLTVPGDIAPGSYILAIKIDAGDEVSESNETNNVRLSVQPLQVLRDDGVMLLDGTEEGDFLILQHATFDDSESVEYNTGAGFIYSYPLAGVSGFDVHGYGGDDIIEIRGPLLGVLVDGGDGADRIVGGDGPDTLVGGAGKDVLDGRLGNDRLNGNGGNDKLFGGAGADRLYGYRGNDYLDGGSSGDRLDGGRGIDTLFGQSGNDRFFIADGEVDHVFGASGIDTAQHDADDILYSVEL